MSEIKHAIKIEQLKNERAKMINPLQYELVLTEQKIRVVDDKIKELQAKRNTLNAQNFELRNRIYSNNQHFDLMIKAYQNLQEKKTP